MPFETTLTVRLGHTDAARRLYFARQFDLVHAAYEDWLAHAGLSIRDLVHDESGGLPIVHAESDYMGQVFVGDDVVIAVTVDHVGTRSFTLAYALSVGGKLVGKAKTVHVAIDGSTGRSGPLPDALTQALKTHAA